MLMSLLARDKGAGGFPPLVIARRISPVLVSHLVSTLCPAAAHQWTQLLSGALRASRLWGANWAGGVDLAAILEAVGLGAWTTRILWFVSWHGSLEIV